MTRTDHSGCGYLYHVFPVSSFTFHLFSIVLLVSLLRVRGDTFKEKRMEYVEVKTEAGVIRGQRMERQIPNLAADTVSDVYDKFCGVPYAKPPIGPLRFAAPVQPDPWPGVVDTLHKRPSCPQPVYELEMHYVNQSEDCLYLNVFSPFQKENPDAKYPVILYIHGGSFESGSGHVYDGKVLCSIGVVVVTINYRLGALGFLTSGDEVLPGNYGLRDQLMAIKWVNRNIAKFRGDPTKVSLVGHSVGASSVGLLMTIEEVKGMFQAVVAQSGSASALYSCYNSSYSKLFKDYVRKVGALLKCSVRNEDAPTAEAEKEELTKIRDCLRNVRFQLFIEYRFSFPLYDKMGVEFRPYVDGDLIVREPRESFKQGLYTKVPFYTGIVEREFNFYFEQAASQKEREKEDTSFEQYLLRSFNDQNNIVKMIRFQYTNWSKTQNMSDLKYEDGELLSDFHMVAPTIQLADMISSYQEDVYYYYFKHPLSYHSIELSYLFGTPFGADPADETGKVNFMNFSREVDRNLSRYMMMQWKSITDSGRPTNLGKVDWPQYNRNSRLYLNISSENISISKNLKQNKAFFWNEILPMAFPEARSVLGSGLTSFDKYPSSIDNYMADVDEKNRKDFVTIIILTVCTVILFVLLIVTIGWIVHMKNEVNELKKVAKLYSVSHVV